MNSILNLTIVLQLHHFRALASHLGKKCMAAGLIRNMHINTVVLGYFYMA